MVSDPGDPWFGAQLIDPDSVLEALQAMMLNEILKPPRTARVVGFKEVRHTGAEFASYEEFRAYAMFLNKLLPGVNVILNVRSVRDAATSAWWADMEDATEILSECIRWLTMLDAEAASMGLRCHLVSHDEWSLDPGVLLDTFRACGLDPDPAVITAALSTELTHLKVAPEGDPATAT